ncbi:ubiquitin carboxyl-terminal hydrolase 37-like isoform X2 [Ptychodera flava]|uniref:ubiquitin carboxyl-terminal hydrolase 37-like isoform X2 n=1 Tax=Ptychodera flava TaxID=63121 RepID=UPI00396A9206
MISICGRVRYSGVDCGQMKWKEGNLSVREEKGISYCIMSPKVGNSKKFKLSGNIKSLSESRENRKKIIIALNDGTHIHLDQAKQPDKVNKLAQYLHDLKSNGSNKARSVKLKALSPKQASPEHKDYGTSKHSPRSMTPSSRNSTTLRKSEMNSLYASSNTTPWREKTSPVLANGVARSISRDHDENSLDKENEGIVRSSSTPRSDRKGLFERKAGPASTQFLSAFDDKQKALEDRKSSTPGTTLSVGFYSRGQQMVNHGLNNSFISSARSNVTPMKRQPGFLSDPTHLIKKPRLGENYEGWRRKNKVILDNTSQVSLHGFSNLGNTCYMNAILQALFGLETFATDIMNFELIRKNPKQSLYRCLTHLLHVKRIGRSVMPEQKDLLKKVKNAISSSAERFSGFLQHDAHEFLNQCLDQLKEDVEKVNKGSRTSSPKSENSENIPETEESAENTFTCPVTLNFEFEVLHVITCDDCDETVTKAERFYDLSLDMPKRKDVSIAKSIQDALDQFFRDEKIEYECNECHGKQSTVTHKFTKLPRILVLHLKRYSYNTAALKNTKLGESINIPKYLTLGLHCNNETSPPHFNDRKPAILSPTKQEKCWGSHDETDAKSMTARKRLYGDSSGPNSSKSRFKFKRIQKQNESDSEDEEISQYNKGSNSILPIKKDSKQNDIESDFKPLTELTEDEQIAKVLEMSKEEDMTQQQDSERNNSKDVSFTFDELTCMTEEEQLAKAMELSKQESLQNNLESSQSDDDVSDAQRDSGEVGLRGGGILKEADLPRGDLGGDVDTDESDCEASPKENCNVVKGTDTTDDGCTQSNEGDGTAQVTVHHNASTNVQFHNPLEHKGIGNLGQFKSFSDLALTSSNSLTTMVSVPKEPKTPGKDTIYDLTSTSGSDENNESNFHSLFDKVKRSDGKCKQYSAKRSMNFYSLSKKTNDSKIEDNIKGTQENDKQDNQESEEGENATKAINNEAIDLGDFYNDYDKDKEDKDLAAAISASMKDQSVLDQEDEDIKRAKELSLQDYEKSLFESMDQGVYTLSDGENEPELTKEELETLKINEEESLPFAYQLVSVVSHIGSTTSMGHYISDVYDFKKRTWLKYDDTEVDKTDEITVRTRRRRSGYIFFYLNKDIFDDLSHDQDPLHSRHSLPR